MADEAGAQTSAAASAAPVEAGLQEGAPSDAVVGAVEVERGEETEEVGYDAEDKIALQLRSHTESWQGKKDTQEDRRGFAWRARGGRLGAWVGWVRVRVCGRGCWGWGWG